jgi:tetratricopeptide (TPR) repeat protein
MQQRARTRQRMGAYTSALGELTRAERLLAGDGSLEARRERVRLMAVRASIRQEQERIGDATAVARELIEEARATGEADALEAGLMVLDVTAFQLGDTSVGANTREALGSALEHGRLKRASVAQSNLGGFAFYNGDWDVAVEWYSAARDVGQAVGDAVGAAFVGLNLGELRVSRRELDVADDVLAESVRVLRVAGSHDDAAYGVLHQARSRLLRGDLLGAEQLAEEVELEFAALGQRMSAMEATLVRAESLTRQGRPAQALVLVEASQVSAPAEGVALLPRIHLERGRALAVLGRAPEAALEVESGLVLARQHTQAYEEASLLLVQADVAARSGAPAAAERASADAEAILHRLGVRTEPLG